MLRVQKWLLFHIFLQDFQPSHGHDVRFLREGHTFSTCRAYKLSMEQDDVDTHASTIWFTWVSCRVKIFAWLLFLDRLNTKANLFQKHIASSAACPRCGHASEDSLHLFITCPLAGRIWQRLGIHPTTAIDSLWTCTLPLGVDLSTWCTILLIILWKIWAAQNKMAFEHVDLHSSLTLRFILDDLVLWTYRLKKPAYKVAALSWRLYLSQRANIIL